LIANVGLNEGNEVSCGRLRPFGADDARSNGAVEAENASRATTHSPTLEPVLIAHPYGRSPVCIDL